MPATCISEWSRSILWRSPSTAVTWSASMPTSGVRRRSKLPAMSLHALDPARDRTWNRHGAGLPGARRLLIAVQTGPSRGAIFAICRRSVGSTADLCVMIAWPVAGARCGRSVCLVQRSINHGPCGRTPFGPSECRAKTSKTYGFQRQGQAQLIPASLHWRWQGAYAFRH